MNTLHYTLSCQNKLVKPLEISTSSTAVCIVSGGLDSVCTAAYLTKEKRCSLYILSFIYGQRARNEILIARQFAKILKVKDHRILDIAFMKQLYSSTNVLTDAKKYLPRSFDYSVVVPVRNAIFITVAAAWAMSINARIIAYGAHVGDAHYYPDCRPEFIKSISNMLNLAEADGIRSGLRQKVTVWAPVVEGIDKTELLKIGYSILGDKIFKTWSCYSNGIKMKGSILHCGSCESCINRKVAISKAGIEDKTHYAKNEE
jgi:7-cyano-7-deazaguanine synthase